MNKEKILSFLKKISSYVLITVALIGGFVIGRHHIPKDTQTPKPPNPYTNILKPSEVSIAVNENDELLILERKTGRYMVYSNEIGENIFKMYTNRIYQEVQDEN